MELKTVESFLKDLRTLARIYYPEFDTGEGAVLNDLLFRIHAYAGELFLRELLRVLDQLLLDKLTGDELEAEARKYGLVRKQGNYAYGRVVFYSYSAPPAAGILIPAGTSVMTRFGTKVYEFKTTADVRLFPTDYVSVNGRYETVADVVAVEPGREYNVGAGMISFIKTAINGVNGVINYDTMVGGTDVESDESLRMRILNRMLGRNFGSVVNYESLIADNFSVADVKVVGPGLEFFRLTGPDAVVIYEQFSSFSDEYAYDPLAHPGQIFVLSKQPVNRILQVFVNAEELPPSEYELIKDTGAKRDTVWASDSIHILRSLVSGDIVRVNYSYFAIWEIQDFLRLADVRVPAIDIWVREGRRYEVNLKLRVSFFGGVDVVAERMKIVEALGLLLVDYDLGEPLDKSDIISVVQKGYADVVIDSVDYAVVEYWRGESLYGEVLSEDVSIGRLLVPFNGYVRLGTVEFL